MSVTATTADLDLVTDMIALAFAIDPVWGTALARPDGSTEHFAAYWRPYIEGALRHSAVYLAEGAAAVAVWIPPGCDEMTQTQEAEVLALVENQLPAESLAPMLTLWDRFTAAQPPGTTHAYLSLLATHPQSRGQGIGQKLLRENLERFDAQGIPTYLESTNPANNHRYERAGFSRLEGFTSTFDSAPITRMWRPVGGS